MCDLQYRQNLAKYSKGHSHHIYCKLTTFTQLFLDGEERQNLLENEETERDDQESEQTEVKVNPESEAIGFIQAVRIPGVIPVRHNYLCTIYVQIKGHLPK